MKELFKDIRVPRKLRPGDRARFVSPASSPDPRGVERCRRIIEGWGLQVEYGAHIFDTWGYLAGTDADRAQDINDALRDPGVRAIFATRGGKGAYRIADSLDFDAARIDPKPLVGFSEITILQAALYKQAKVPAIHGPMVSWSSEFIGDTSVELLRQSLMEASQVIVEANEQESTSALTTTGTAEGILLGGNLDMLACAAGWSLPCMQGAILFIEETDKGLGHIDRNLTRLIKGGYLNGVQGVAVGQFTKCWETGGWTALDVLRDRLALLNVPILGGIPVGHGKHSVTLPLGTWARLNAANGQLVIEPAVSSPLTFVEHNRQ